MEDMTKRIITACHLDAGAVDVLIHCVSWSAFGVPLWRPLSEKGSWS